MRLPFSLRFRLLDLYLGLICLFPLTTMLVDGTVINKLMFVVLFALQIYSLFSVPVRKKTVLLLLLLILQYLFVLWHTEFPLVNSNLLFYFPYFLVYTYYMHDNMNDVIRWLSQRKRYIHGIVVLWSVIVGISILVPSCYYVKEGGALYFGSWTSDIFRLGPSVMFIQILVIVLQVLHKQKYTIAYMVIPMYCVLMGSSRTYLVISGLLFVISWYFSFKNKQHFWITILPLSVLFAVVLMNSSMWEKILYTLDEDRYGDFWFKITSSRSVLWKEDMEAWRNLPLANRLFGCDINLTNRVTGKWGHNDFVEILCSFGLIGIIQYVSAMYSLIRKSLYKIRIPCALLMCVVFVWLINAFFNMHYVYFCAMLSFPLLLFSMRSHLGDNGVFMC